MDLGLDDERRRILEDYLKTNNYRYTIEEARLGQSRKQKDDGTHCFWCAFNRRKRLFQTAQKFGCSKIALGHHKDDIAETFLLNLFFHGEITTMVLNQPLFNGRFRIIRPLVLCEEKFVIGYARASNFPEFNSKCPNADTSKRMLMKNLLGMVSEFNSEVKTNIFRSMKRIKYDYIIQ